MTKITTIRIPKKLHEDAIKYGVNMTRCAKIAILRGVDLAKENEGKICEDIENAR